jgi:diaminohydroxyphosphoribosylaminopyrimidine deaminase / 5-amino-6-(5-phosphoribosylamino)uracil reductase
MMAALAAEGINELHVEAGARLNGALLAAGLVDELLVYFAPCLLGDSARGMFALPAPLERLSDRTPLRIAGVDRIGTDWRILARIER